MHPTMMNQQNMMMTNPGPMYAGPIYNKPDLTLYVGNLHLGVADEMLFNEFGQYGKVTSLRIMKDSFTKDSRGFGYVVFQDLVSANRAQREMNNKELFKRELRVHFKKNIKVFNNDANFILKNIAKNVTSKQLNEECSKYGNIVSCFVRKEEDAITKQVVSLGYGYVQFEKVENGNAFFEDFNGKELNGQKVSVEVFLNAQTREKTECKNLYMNNFPANWTMEQIQNFVELEFTKFGEVESKGIFLYDKTQKFYAFVAFKEAQSAFEALEKMNGIELDGEKLFVTKAQTKSKRKYLLGRELNQASHPQTNIYIRSLKAAVNEELMRIVFSKYGTITSVCLREWIPVNKAPEAVVPNAPTLQYGFINFQTAEEAQNVLLNYKKDQEIKDLVSVETDVNFLFMAQPKETRVKYLIMQKRMKDSARSNLQNSFTNKQNFKKNNRNQQNQGMNYPINAGMHQYGNFQMNNGMPAVGAMPVNQGQNSLLDNLNSNKPMENFMSTTDYKKVAEDLRKNKAEFIGKSVDDQKNFLGNIMYARVRSMQKDESLIPKITGMLIDTEVLEFEEILEIIEDDKALKERIDEAIEVINDNAEIAENKEGELTD